MRILDIIALTLTVVGGINWLLVGAFRFDLVATIFGGSTKPLARIIYVLVGLSALYSISFFSLF